MKEGDNVWMGKMLYREFCDSVPTFDKLREGKKIDPATIGFLASLATIIILFLALKKSYNKIYERIEKIILFQKEK